MKNPKQRAVNGMKARRNRYNHKRRIQNGFPVEMRENLVVQVQYGGNPEHKRNPGDFGLTPPASPRAHKTLCDDCGIHSKSVALALLAEGIIRGMVSTSMKGQWPQNVWAVTKDGHPVEAQLENREIGTYHGYPLPEADPMRNEILNRWHLMPEAGTKDDGL